MKKIHVFTSAAFNYTPKVRMLFQSLRKLHPEWVLHLALADKIPAGIDLSQEPFDEIHQINELNIPNWNGWAFCHTIVELATAIKPFALHKLLSRPDCEKVLYLDPDIVVFSRLDDILHALDSSNVVLTPHVTIAETTLTGVMDNEISSLKHGVYNLGFVGVSANAEGLRFADWWGRRIYNFCRADIPNGLFTDQRWIDLVPALFEGVSILRSVRFNVAPWNLTKRTITGDFQSGFKVNGEPLGFYHFTGFDSGAHKSMSVKNSSGNDAVHTLVDWYRSETEKLSNDPLTKIAWAFGKFSNGEKIEPAHRMVYCERVDLQYEFADPFFAGGLCSFVNWWKKNGKTDFPELFYGNKIKSDLNKTTRPLLAGYIFKNSFYEDVIVFNDKIIFTAPEANLNVNPENILKKINRIYKLQGVAGVLKKIKDKI